MNIPLGALFQWGDNPNNQLCVLEKDQENDRYVLLVATPSLEYPNGMEYRSDLGDVITLSSGIVEKFSQPCTEVSPAFFEAQEIFKERLMEEKIAAGLLLVNFTGQYGVS